ncbi:MAG TPA: hypothetical protein VF943_14005 [Burkholderiales bacterium]
MLKRLGWTVIAGVLVAFVAMPLALAQPAPRDMSQKADDAWDSLKSYTVDKKKEAVATGRKVMTAVDRDLKDLEASAAKAGGEAKAEMRKDIKALKVQRAEASKKLNAMGKATAAAWDSTKNGFIEAAHDLHDGVEKAAAKLK